LSQKPSIAESIQESLDSLRDNSGVYSFSKSAKTPNPQMKLIPVIDQINRRQSQRASLPENKLELKFGNAKALAKHFILDISSGGMLIKSDYKPPVGESISISFSAPSVVGDESPQHFDLRGKIVRHTQDGIGLEFHEIPALERRRIDALVSQLIHQSKGLNLHEAQSKYDESLAKLNEIRTQREEAFKSRKNLSLNLLFIGILLGLNLWTFDFLDSPRESQQKVSEHPSQIQMNKMNQEKDQVIVRFNSQSGTEVRWSQSKDLLSEEEFANLPTAARLAVDAARKAPPKIKRVSKTAKRSLVELK